MPASGAVTCAVKLTPGGSVAAVGGEVVAGDVLGGADVVPAVRGDPLPPPHAPMSVAMRANATSAARQRANTRRSAPGARSAGWIKTSRTTTTQENPGSRSPRGPLHCRRALGAYVAVSYPVVRGAAGTATAATAGARAGAAAGARAALGARAGVGAAARVGAAAGPGGAGAAGGAGGGTGAGKHSLRSPLSLP